MSAGGIIDELKKIPPVTRFLCGATLAVTLPVNLQLVSPYSIVFVKEFVTQNLEIWRPFTSMFFAGSGMSLIFEFIMLYRNADSLESTHYAGESADLAWQLFLNCLGIHALNIPFRTMIHFRPLLLSLLTLSARLSPEAQTSIFGLLTLKQAYLPYAMVAMDFMMGGTTAAANALTGVISGYAWWYLVHNADAGRPGLEFARAPAWLRSLIGETGVRVIPGAGHVLNEGRNRAAAAGRVAARTARHNWGSGNRLGQE